MTYYEKIDQRFDLWVTCLDACCWPLIYKNPELQFLRATAYMLSAHMLSQFRPSVCLSVCPSVCPSVTRVDQSKTAEVIIMQFSPHSSPIPLVFAR